MPNTCNWDPSTNSFMVVLVAPDKPDGTPGSASVQLSATPVTPQVMNRVYSSYNGPPSTGKGFGYTWWQEPPTAGGPPVGSPNWNVPGPAYGQDNIVFYITPTYETTPNTWDFFSGPSAMGPGGDYTFNDPSGGGSSSIVISMIEPGGGGLAM